MQLLCLNKSILSMRLVTLKIPDHLYNLRYCSLHFYFFKSDKKYIIRKNGIGTKINKYVNHKTYTLCMERKRLPPINNHRS